MKYKRCDKSSVNCLRNRMKRTKRNRLGNNLSPGKEDGIGSVEGSGVAIDDVVEVPATDRQRERIKNIRPRRAEKTIRKADFIARCRLMPEQTKTVRESW